MDLKRDFAAGVYLSEAKNPIPLPLHTVNEYTVYLFTQGRGEGGEVNQREGYWGNSSQTRVENTNMTECISSLSTLVKTCREAPLQVRNIGQRMKQKSTS